MKKYYKVIVLVLALALVVQASNVFAHDLGYRWDRITYSSTYNHNVCEMKTNNDSLDSYYGDIYYTATMNWNNYSNNYVKCVDSSYSLSNVDMFMSSDFQNEFGVDAIGIGIAYDSNMTSYLETGFNGEVRFGKIYFNSNSIPSNGTQRTFVMVHEIGHILGLAHSSVVQVSVMNPYVPAVDAWSNIDRPQDHDRTDLASYY